MSTDKFSEQAEKDNQSIASSNQPHEYQLDLSHNDGVQKIIKTLSQGAGGLGELEEPYDIEKIHTHPKPDTTFHEKDKWKYPVDAETGLRIVKFLPDDKENPKNFSSFRKWAYTFLLGFAAFVVALGSAIVTGDIDRPAEHFQVSVEVIILASVTTFVIGFGVGPLVFAPMSEEIGRKPVYASTLFLSIIFIVPCGAAKNIGTLLICRLIDGTLFSAPMCLVGGSLADLFEGKQRGLAMTVFSAAPFLGPVMGPIFGGLLCDYADSWRWVYWTFLIVSGFMYIVFIGLVPETHGPTLLNKRAKKLRKLTGDETYLSIAELKPRTIKEIAYQSLVRPFLLLSELIVFLMTMYMTVVYGLLYMFFFAFPVVYMEGKGFSASKTGVMFIPIGVGVILSGISGIFINKDYNKRAQKYYDKGESPPPELRLIPMMIGCWFIPVGLFIFAWTSYPRLSFLGPFFASFPIGFGFTILYNSANSYIIDSYQFHAASALAAKTFVRSIWGAAVPLFTIQMYHKLGYQWATSLMAFIALACCLIPYLFYIFGERIRSHSRFAYNPTLT